MAYVSYAEKLRDQRWQKKRLEIMQRDGFACVRCGDKESTLNVHHGYYQPRIAPWDYPDYTLWTLCESCHKFIEWEKTKAHFEIARLDPKVCDGWGPLGFQIHRCATNQDEKTEAVLKIIQSIWHLTGRDQIWLDITSFVKEKAKGAEP